MKTIPLTKGYVAVVDDEDFVALSNRKWHALVKKSTNRVRVYAVHLTSVDGKRFTEYMHRTILSASNGVRVDHRDGNELNNRRDNLRAATPTENNRNQRKTRGMSLFKGVYYENRGRIRWRAQATLCSKRVSLGSFDSEEEAARAYDDFVKEHFGEFARLNFPEVA